MATPSSPGRIDVHAHFVPDFYREQALAAGLRQPDHMPNWPAWSETEALAVMDRLGVAAQVLSISSPGVRFGSGGDDAARQLARQVNEAGAGLVQRHPTRFGLFATLPLPDVAGALAELPYALDTLHADGIILETNYLGVYLGDARLAPLLAALHERQAVVFLHPTAPPNGEQVRLGYPLPLLEFMFDTTRCVTQLLLAQVPQRYPGIRWIVPHAGAALPVLLDRVVGQAPLMHLSEHPEELVRTLGNFYFDLAGTPLPRTLPALLSLTTPAQLLYGTDYCFAPEASAHLWQSRLDPYLHAGGHWAAAMHENAARLLPRLARPA